MAFQDKLDLAHKWTRELDGLIDESASNSGVVKLYYVPCLGHSWEATSKYASAFGATPDEAATAMLCKIARRVRDAFVSCDEKHSKFALLMQSIETSLPVG